MRTVDKVRQDMAARLEWERQDEVRKRKEKEDRIRREFERRMNPKSREDFDLLYHALESKLKQLPLPKCLLSLNTVKGSGAMISNSV